MNLEENFIDNEIFIVENDLGNYLDDIHSQESYYEVCKNLDSQEFQMEMEETDKNCN